ncbi:hypothetical protein EDD37DRAFT_604869 [Exophiala viscosa]|uniref:uncharacterized protein n=1 Tax=Exophiala viscosa TaxID=2486360 RepID=UPI00218C9ECF|nr:hypothetical protein EDD37DRAFT_604869 [Exophiala viscosa]
MACERHGCSSLSTILSLASVVTPTATPLSQKRKGLAFAAFKKNADPGPIWEKLAACKTSTKLRLDGSCLDEWQKKLLMHTGDYFAARATQQTETGPSHDFGKTCDHKASPG